MACGETARHEWWGKTIFPVRRASMYEPVSQTRGGRRTPRNQVMVEGEAAPGSAARGPGWGRRRTAHAAPWCPRDATKERGRPLAGSEEEEGVCYVYLEKEAGGADMVCGLILAGPPPRGPGDMPEERYALGTCLKIVG